MKMKCIICGKRFVPTGIESVFLCVHHRETVRKVIRKQMNTTLRHFAIHRRKLVEKARRLAQAEGA